MGKKGSKVNSLKNQQISERLFLIARYHTPSEFSIKPREFKAFKFWKETEVRAFILYFETVVSKGVLPNHLYDHFVNLHVAITYTFYSEKTQCQSLVSKLCNTSVQYTTVFNAKELMLYNFHNLLHVVNDVVNFGPLDYYSTFLTLENSMRNLKGITVRKPNNAFQQVAKRLCEKCFLDVTEVVKYHIRYARCKSGSN